MRSTATTVRRVFLFAFALALLTALGCSGGEDGGTRMIQLTCSDGGPASANVVNMICGVGSSGVTERVDVVIGGPAAGSTTLRGLNFDVIFDPAKVEFVSVQNAAGDLFPQSALLDAALFDGQQGRLVVSIQQAGGNPDVAVVPGQHVVMSFSFQLVAGATFGPTPLEFDPSRSEATNASTAISFASDFTLAYQ